MKNPAAIITAMFLCALALTAFTQDPVKPPPTQQPPTKPTTQDAKEKTPDEDQDVLKILTRQVTVPVIVTDGYGRFINGLKKTDFSIREDGVEQVIEDFNDERSPFNVALLVDLSLSTKNKLDDIKRTAIDFVKLLQPRDKVLVVAFDEKVQFIGNFTGDQKSLEKSIKSLKTSYLTSIYDAIDATIRDRLAVAEGRKAIVVLSDGVDTGSKRATYDSILELITRTGIITYTVRYETRNDGGKKNIKPDDLPNLRSPFINRYSNQFLNGFASGFANNWQQPRGVYQKQKPKDRDLLGIEFLQQLADRSGARYLRSESAEGTAYALALVANELRNQYTLTYEPANKEEDGQFRQIDVAINRRDLLVRARQGYIAPKPATENVPDKPKP
ncbi:MAG TPA: VWA domain-containing protein [Blastocatellia bacterium]|nr:VWA domain-containing protein [Blastocatellia bacterium]